VLAVLGFFWIVWLVATEPEIEPWSGNPDAPGHICFAVLTDPHGGLTTDRAEVERNETGSEGLLDSCERKRDRRLAIAVLVAPVVAVLGAFSVSGATGPRR
jgi:hypothetical protein